MKLRPPRWSSLAKHWAILLVLVGLAGAAFVWSGLYNVAASSDHFAVTTWLLERVRVRSVATHSHFVPEPPPLDDLDRVRLGAAHFEGGCRPCHGRPGAPVNAIPAGMLPPPPPLSRTVAGEDAEALFWIVKHGLKYTAMPAWPAQMRDDEVWALTAFVRRLPGMTPETYNDLAAPSDGLALVECGRCHGSAFSPPVSNLIPSLHGQSQAYLERALAEYAAGVRPSGIMEPVADLLDAEAMSRNAAHYASLEPLPPATEGDAGRIARGRALAMRGDPERGIPPCLACHADGRAATFPDLAGQSAPYLAGQLRLWRGGGRDGSAYGQIMAVVARRLSETQVEDAAAYFASLGAAPPSGGSQ